MVIALVKHAGRWLNNFCPKNGISKVLSPKTIITGVKPNYNKDCKLEIGAYVQVHQEYNPTNRIDQPRTDGAIALEATGNIQGSSWFLNFSSV